MNISFTANLKSQTIVQSKNNDGKYKKCTASVIEFDKSNFQDLDALEELSLKWSSEKNNISSCIYNEATKDTTFSASPSDIKHFIGITLQKDNFEKIKAKEILSLSVFTESKAFGNELNWLVVNPKIGFNAGEDRPFRHVGKAMIKYLINNYQGNPISVLSVCDAIKFYKKLGFKSYCSEIPEALIYKFSRTI